MSEESTTPDLVELTSGSFGCQSPRSGRDDGLLRPGCRVGHVADGARNVRGGGGDPRLLEDWLGAYEEEHEFEAEETLDLGNGVGFRVLIQKGRPVGSSGEVELRYAAVSVWEDGMIARVTNYTDIDEARAAAERLAEERG